MAAAQVISGAGKFSPGALSTLVSDLDPQADTLSVVAAIGALGSGQSSLLNGAFGTAFATGSPVTREGRCVQVTKGVCGQRADVPDVAVLAAPPRQMVVLNIEGYDSRERARADVQERCLAWAMGLADMVVWTVRMGEIARENMVGLAGLRAAWVEGAKLVEKGVVQQRTFRRLFLVVVKDYEADVLGRQELITGFLERIQSVWASVPRPPGVGVSKIDQAFDFEFVTLPVQKYEQESYNKGVGVLNKRLTDPAADEYLFEGGAYKRTSDVSVGDEARSIWSALEEERQRDLPDENELNGTLSCDHVIKNVYDKYEKNVRVWKRQVDGGSVIENFGKECAELLNKTLSVYDSDASAYKGTHAFLRKREELREKLDASLYDLFTKQTLILREVVYSKFKEKLLRIELNPKVEKEVNKALKESQKMFKKEIDSIRPRGVSWRYDNEAKGLVSHMREDATERLQQARLSGVYKPAKRQPVSVSFHYLDPAPFGWKDSRYERLSFDDEMKYEPMPTTRAKPESRDTTTESAWPPVPILDTPEQKWNRRNEEFVYKEKKKTPSMF